MGFGLRVLARVLIQIAFLVQYAELAKFSPCQSHESCVRLDKCPHIHRVIHRQGYNLTPDQINLLAERQCDLDSQAGSYLERIYVCCPEPGNVLPDVDTCGQGPLPLLTNRIYGGTDAQIEEFPWMAMLLYESPVTSRKFQRIPHSWCAGSLINNRYVLTAAHCLVTRFLIESGTVVTSVRLGIGDTSLSSDCRTPCLELDVEQRIVHESFRIENKTHEHDIALLRLHLPVRYTSVIKPICVSTSSGHQSWDSFSVGTEFKIAGWGKTESLISSSVLLKSSIRGRYPKECRERYGFLRDSQLCAGGWEGKDTCLGDSGSPLMATIGLYQSVYLAGITSFGSLPCGLPGWPAVFTRTAAYIDWIKLNIRA